MLSLTESKKDPGVPNSYPFKEQVLQEAEEHKRRVSDKVLTRISHTLMMAKYHLSVCKLHFIKEKMC